MAQVQKIAIRDISPNPKNVRKKFPRETLTGLAASIKKRGVICPIIVTPNGSPTKFTIVAGERRWRAAAMAGLSDIPALVRANLDDRAMIEIGLVENLQREALNYLDEARAYECLKSEFGLTDQDIAQIVGKSRSTVANMRRLLSLPPDVAEAAIREGLPMRHARRLVTLSKTVKTPKIVAAVVSIAQVSSTNAAAADRIVQDLSSPVKSESDQDLLLECVSMLKYAFSQPPDIEPDLWQSMQQAANKVCNDCGINTMTVCKDCPGTLVLKKMLPARRIV